jgi:hypothetical protein
MKSRSLLLMLSLSTTVFAQDLEGPAPKKADATKPSSAEPNKDTKDTTAGEKKPERASAGYTYSDTPRAASKGGGRVRKSATKNSVIASYPTLTQEQGHSRLSVRLSKNVTVETHKAEGAITYVIKGARIAHWNDTHPLVTVHFNTPVSVAALHPHKGDVEFRVELRSAVEPTQTIEQSGDAAVLHIDFPAGEFLKTEATPEPAKPAAP